MEYIFHSRCNISELVVNIIFSLIKGCWHQDKLTPSPRKIMVAIMNWLTNTGICVWQMTTEVFRLLKSQSCSLIIHDPSRCVPLLKHKLFIPLWHQMSPTVVCRVYIPYSLAFCVAFGRSLFDVFHLTIALSVLLSDLYYPFVISKVVLYQHCIDSTSYIVNQE